tara:strand:+ start:26 stop:844 length:819 start_codon:yes stop_codon:yes gene_type:complete
MSLPVANFLRFEPIVSNIVANSPDTIKGIFDGSDDVCYPRNDMRNVHFDDGYGCKVCTLKKDGTNLILNSLEVVIDYEVEEGEEIEENGGNLNSFLTFSFLSTKIISKTDYHYYPNTLLTIWCLKKPLKGCCDCVRIIMSYLEDVDYKLVPIEYIGRSHKGNLQEAELFRRKSRLGRKMNRLNVSERHYEHFEGISLQKSMTKANIEEIENEEYSKIINNGFLIGSHDNFALYRVSNLNYSGFDIERLNNGIRTNYDEYPRLRSVPGGWFSD